MEQVFLGTTLYHAMRSRPLVDLLHKAGHIKLQANPQAGHLTSAINMKNGTIVPPNLNPGNFTKFTAGNIDNNDLSLDGKNTPSAQHRRLFGKETQVKQSVWQAWGLPTKLTTLVIPGPKHFAATTVSWYCVRQKCPGIYRTCWTEVLYCFPLRFGIRYTFRNRCFRTQSRQRLHASWISIGLCLDLNSIPEACLVLVPYQYTTGCGALHSKCRKSHVVCTAQCGCSENDAWCCINRC